MGPVFERTQTWLNLIRKVLRERHDLIAAVDGGVHLAKFARVSLDMGFGDWDGAQRPIGIRTISFRSTKNRSDTCMTFRHLRQMGVTHVTCLGFLGGRADHELAVLLDALDSGVVADFWSPRRAVFVLNASSRPATRDRLVLQTNRGSHVSVFSVDSSARGVELTGFEYSGRFDRFDASSLGLSNRCVKPKASIRIAKGRVLVFLETPKSVRKSENALTYFSQ